MHLQCHFGMDTLSWAKLGATVTGIDFSPKAVEAAKLLSEQSGVSGRFIEAELYDSPSILSEQFDIVYTGVGAINWLPDIKGWAEVVSHFLKPGGLFYIREAHPVLWSLEDDREDDKLIIRYPYFETTEPEKFEEEGTYTDGGEVLGKSTIYAWNHGLSEVMTALIDVGLKIEAFREYRFCEWQALTVMESGEDGRWRLPRNEERLPLMYSILARKESPVSE